MQPTTEVGLCHTAGPAAVNVVQRRVWGGAAVCRRWAARGI